MVDVLDIYFVEHVKKAKGDDGVDDFLVEVCQYCMDHGNIIKAQALLERVIAHTKSKRPEISNMIAASFEK